MVGFSSITPGRSWQCGEEGSTVTLRGPMPQRWPWPWGSAQQLHPTAARQGRHGRGAGPWPRWVPIAGILGSDGGRGPCRGSQ